MFDCSVFIWFLRDFFGIYIYIYIYCVCVCTEDEGVKVEAELGAPPTLTHFNPLMQT